MEGELLASWRRRGARLDPLKRSQQRTGLRVEIDPFDVERIGAVRAGNSQAAVMDSDIVEGDCVGARRQLQFGQQDPAVRAAPEADRWTIERGLREPKLTSRTSDVRPSSSFMSSQENRTPPVFLIRQFQNLDPGVMYGLGRSLRSTAPWTFTRSPRTRDNCAATAARCALQSTKYGPTSAAVSADTRITARTVRAMRKSDRQFMI